jgi:hypothetical protein
MGRPKIAGQQPIADWSGVYLLTTLAAHEPARLASLEPSAWQAWAPAIIGAWNSDSEKGSEARCGLIDLAPHGTVQSIDNAALNHLDALQEHGVTSPRTSSTGTYVPASPLRSPSASSAADTMPGLPDHCCGFW